MGRITVACIRNPFDPLLSREIREFEPGKSIRELVDDFYPEGSGDYTVEIAVDGRRIGDPCIVPLPGASVVFCAVPSGGGGKNPLAIVAMLAIMLVAGPIGEAAGGYLGAAIGGAAGVEAYGGMISSAVTIGTVVAGGLLVSAVFPMAIPEANGPNQLSNSPTYSWNPAGNLIVEGGALPEVFGVHRVVPPCIARYVDISGDKQYLNMLFAVAGHPLDSISSVRINGNPIDSFTDVEYDWRPGSSSQTVIAGFEKIRVDVPVSAKLQYDINISNGWTTRVTTGNVIDRFGIVLGFPRGLYQIDANGSVVSTSVKVYLEYRRVGSPEWEWIRGNFPNVVPITLESSRWSGGWVDGEGLWTEIEVGRSVYGDHTEGETYNIGSALIPEYNAIGTWRWIPVSSVINSGTITVDYIEVVETSTYPIYRSFYLPADITPGQYEIRCRLVDAPSESSRVVRDVYLSSLQEIVNESCTYPGVSLLSVRALATDQLSGSGITVDCLASRQTVYIGGGPAPGDAPANNPAWACYYLLNREGEGVPDSRINYLPFLEWASKCRLRGYTVNLYIDSTGSLRRALDMAALNGRGVVVQMGSKFTCLVDLPDDTPVQRFLFTMGNIAADSFAEEWMAPKDRANAVEVTYFDADLDYVRTTVEIYADDYDTSPMETNKAAVTMYGCTSKDLATKYGRFLLACNRYLTLTSSWQSDVDAIACLPGDPIDVAHDVPQWGQSGRLVSYDSGTGEMVFDREVTIPGSYTVYVVMVRRMSDDSSDLFQIVATAPPRVTDTVTVVLISSSGGVGGAASDGAIVDSGEDGALVSSDEDGAIVDTGTATYAGSVYSVGALSTVVKQMRVLRISRDRDSRKKLTCLEYVSDIYVDGVTY